MSMKPDDVDDSVKKRRAAGSPVMSNKASTNTYSKVPLTDTDTNVKFEVIEFKGHNDYRTKFLCLTSASMLFPFALQQCWGLQNWQSYFMSYWCILTWCVSVLYWHDARPSWRLDLDNFFAKFSFLVVVFFGAMYGQDIGSSCFGWMVGGVIVVLYLASCRMFEAKNPYWIYPHGLMHLCVGSNMAVCVWTGNRVGISRQIMDTCGLHPLDAFFATLASAVNVLFRRT